MELIASLSFFRFVLLIQNTIHKVLNFFYMTIVERWYDINIWLCHSFCDVVWRHNWLLFPYKIPYESRKMLAFSGLCFLIYLDWNDCDYARLKGRMITGSKIYSVATVITKHNMTTPSYFQQNISWYKKMVALTS